MGRETAVASALAISMAAQAALPTRGQVDITAALIGGLSAMLAYQLWMARRGLNAHIDMLLMMGGFGGVAMALSGWFYPAGCPMHREPWSAASITMTGAMLVAGWWPSLRWSRCLQVLKGSWLLGLVMLVESAGMIAGMALFPAWDRKPLTGQIAMWTGMMLGMGLSMMIRQPLLNLFTDRRRSAGRAALPRQAGA